MAAATPSITASTGRGVRALRAWWLVPAALAVLVVVQWAWVAARRGGSETTDAEWIWMRGVNRWSGPTAFYLLRDFTLDTLPGGATVSVVGDPEYVLWLNGTRVGSNRFRADSQPDVYAVDSLLRQGRNRLTAHLRSGSGFGGFLAVLTAPGLDEPLVVSDADWMVARRRLLRLGDPDADLARSERAVVVARPPEGRWRGLSLGLPRPLHTGLVLGGQPSRARRAQRQGAPWRGRRSQSGFGARPLGRHVIFDWGTTRTGYLVLAFRHDEPSVGLVYLGLGLPDPLRWAPDATVIRSPGERWWEASEPRTFRYALVVGVDGLRDAHVVRTDPEAVVARPAGDSEAGVFGLAAPRLRTPVEHVVWGELEGLPGDADG